MIRIITSWSWMYETIYHKYCLSMVKAPATLNSSLLRQQYIRCGVSAE